MAKRRGRRPGPTAGVNIDPLMDVVTCVVGIMLFVVIFAVIEARGSRVEMVTPRLQDPPAGSSRHVFLCEQGRVREFRIDAVTDQFLGQPGRLTYGSVPGLVQRFNKEEISDAYFSYRAEYETERGVDTDKRKVQLVVEERPGSSGDDIGDVKSGTSVFERTVRSLKPDETWISFLVDPESIDVFRSARALAIEHGISVGWDPATLSFPHRSCLVGCGGTGTTGLAAGPQTG